MVGVMPDYNDIGTCNNITHAGLKLFLMPIISSHMSKTTLKQLNELGSEFIDQSLIFACFSSATYICPSISSLVGSGIFVLYIKCEYKVLSVWIHEKEAVEFHVGNIYVHYVQWCRLFMMYGISEATISDRMV